MTPAHGRRTNYIKEKRVNEKTGQEYLFLGPKVKHGRAMNPVLFKAMSQSKVGDMADKET